MDDHGRGKVFKGFRAMKYLLVAPFFGLFGWLVAQSALDHTGSHTLAGLIFGLTVAVMVWGFDLRRRLDG
jgi:hypothetical protein